MKDFWNWLDNNFTGLGCIIAIAVILYGIAAIIQAFKGH